MTLRTPIALRARIAVPALAALALAPGGPASEAVGARQSRAHAESTAAPPGVETLLQLPGVRQAARELRQLRPAAVHPVAAPVDYGEGGARYGADRGGRMHEGQDVFAPAGTPLVAVRDGVVLETGDDGGRGNYLAIWSREAGETYVYLHLLAPPEVGAGSNVRAGQRVGRVGCTGSCYGDHLHFEVRRGRDLEAAPRDPLALLRRWPRA